MLSKHNSRENMFVRAKYKCTYVLFLIFHSTVMPKLNTET